MAKAFAKAFYNSKAWKQCRESYIVSVHGLCERCISKGKITPGYIVHHRILLTPSNINDPEVSLNHKHLEYVCLDCHNVEHQGSSEVIREGLEFDSEGNIIQTPPIN
jgi:5-methylcytosine-specific restriction enzyme A